MKEILLDDRNFDFYDNTYSENHVDYKHQIGLFVIIYVIKSFSIVTIADHSFTINENQFLFIPEGTKDITYNFFGPEHHSILLGFRLFPNINMYNYPPQIIHSSEKLTELVLSIPIDKSEGSKRVWKFYEFLNEFEKHLLSLEQKSYPKISKALKYMEENNDYNIEKLAKLCNLSRERFHTVFKEAMGHTPLDEKHRLQALKAEFLLRSTDMLIEEIAESVGFSSVRHFRKVFKSRYKCNPKTFQMVMIAAREKLNK